MMLKKKEFKQNRGFTLVEVLVALSILTIMIISFTTLLTSSYRNIISAGNKSLATYNVQKEMEERIADELATGVGELQIPFNSGDIIIPGGVLELDDTQGGRTSESTAFLPVLVVIIEPDPEYHLVGVPQTITIHIKTRNVVDNKGVDVAIYKLTDPDTIIDNDNSGVINNNIATVTLEVPAGYDPGDTENDFNHIISVKIDGLDRVFKVFYRIFKPAFLAGAPSGKIYVASNAADLWDEIDTPVNHEILDIYSLTNKFFAVGRSGTILTSDYGSTWTYVTSLTNNDLHAMSSSGSRFVIVGHNGTILISNDSGASWINNSASVFDYSYEEVIDETITLAPETITNNLHAVVNDGANFVAVGDGVILNSKDSGDTWQEVVIGSIIFNDVIYTGLTFIAVGNGGGVYTSPDGENWSSKTITGVRLNSVALNTPGKIVAVGNGGNIFYSSDQGANWSSTTSNTTNDLTGVTSGYGTFVAVGANGTILKSDDGEQWLIVPTPELTANLLTVIDR